MQRQATFPRSGVLILGSNSIHSLVPATLISQVEALLDGHRVPDALALAEHHRKRIQGNHIVNEDEVSASFPSILECVPSAIHSRPSGLEALVSNPNVQYF